MLLAQGEDNDEIAEGLKMEVQALKTRCDGYEKMIEDLTSRSETHENALEMLWQQIVCYLDSQGALSTAYHGKNYDLLP